MRNRLSLLAFVFFLSFSVVWSQQGPGSTGSETKAKPRKKSGDGEPVEEPKQEKIPSKFSKKDGDVLPNGLPTFKSDVSTVNVDVAVLDKNGRFIPNIPKGNFRVIEDGVPQNIGGFNMGEAPMTVCLVMLLLGMSR